MTIFMSDCKPYVVTMLSDACDVNYNKLCSVSYPVGARVHKTLKLCQTNASACAKAKQSLKTLIYTHTKRCLILCTQT